jgi:CheY-like chemotaxis protein
MRMPGGKAENRAYYQGRADDQKKFNTEGAECPEIEPDREAKVMERVVALIDDLFFQMKVAETAKHLGVELKVATNGDALLTLLESAPKLVIVDLNARSQPIQAIERVRANKNDVRVIGFLSHVQTDLAVQARAAGCDEVMPRSSFTQNLAAILGTAKE